MRCKVTVAGDGEFTAACAERLSKEELAEVTTDLEEIAGSDVVVLDGAGEDVLVAVRDRAPNAVLVVADGAIEAACQVTLFPRGRIVGVDPDPGAVVEVIETILLGRDRVFECTARLEGERGVDGEFMRVPVRLGAGGIVEILED